MKIDTAVVVTFSVEGTHRWPECPDNDVVFLRHKHRHVFFFRAEKSVSHNDRETEIIDLGRRMKAEAEGMRDRLLDFGRLSCEQIAERLLVAFDCNYVEVMEDGENGAVARRG